MERNPADHVLDDAGARRTAGEVLAERNRARGIAIVDELSRITGAMADGASATPEEILAVADRIAELRTSVTFTGLVAGA
ncbi:hypothetical protein [Patulibacter sp.]|uniref:hypothetical protein n=1 Tax=Patulibacter sp. TaxID=1912859 RepID=UPI0027289C66|nr:hypothetical protein [Patulibacter sp.]MDO9408314.1 hypothetical protein [Patulibacter sp.]